MEVSANQQKQERFAVRTAWLAAARVASLLLAFLLPFILARKLSVAEFGLYKQAFQILQTGLYMLGLQVASSVFYFSPRYPEKRAQIALNTIIFYALAGGALALWFALQPGWVNAAFDDAGLVPVVPLIGLATMLWLMASGFEAVMLANNEVRYASVMSVLLQLLKTALLVGAALWRGDTRTMALTAVWFGVIQCAIFLVYLYRRFGSFWWPVDWGLLRAQLVNALPFGLGSFAFNWQYDLHNYFVMGYFDAAAYGIYSTGCFQLPLLLALADAMDTILIPEVARLEKEGQYRQIVARWLDGVRLLAFAFLPACALMFVLRRELIVGLYTEKFAASADIFALALLNTLLMVNLTGAVLRPFADLKFYRLKLYSLLVPVNVLLLYVGIRTVGLAGAIGAMVLMRAVDVAVTSWVLGKRLGMTRADVKYLWPLLRIAAAATAAALVVLAVRPLLLHWQPLAAFLLGAVVYGLVFVPAAFLSGAVMETEREMLRGLWAKAAGFRARFGLAGVAGN